MMKNEEVLRNKHILAVDDEADVLEYVGEELSMCLVDKAADYQTALEYIQSYIYDIVILDIMGVDGFRLLEMSVRKDFPTVMLTGHAMTPEALEKAMKLGAACFLPKDKMTELRRFLADVVLEGRKGAWRRLFHELGGFFGRKFGPDWKTKHRFVQEFEEELKMPEGRQTLRDSSSAQDNVPVQ
jgi:CheY-like chemotaxis protein